jgi:hypothetical protein
MKFTAILLILISSVFAQERHKAEHKPRPVTLPMFQPGPPRVDDFFYLFIATEDVKVPADCRGSRSVAAIAPAGAAVFQLFANDVMFGTVEFAPGDPIPHFTCSPIELHAGDALSVITPIVGDPKLSDVAMTFILEKVSARPTGQ